MVGREQGAWSADLLDAVLPGGLVVAFAFQQGGFFAEAVGWMAAGLFLALAVRFAATDDPLAGVGREAWLAIGGLSLLAAWAALSWLWSGAPARALLEADRVALYLAVFAFFASRPWSDGRLRRMRRGFAAAAAIVCACALVTRVLPELWPTTPNALEDRLSYPLGYWNALALLAALGVTLCLQLATDPHEPRGIRAPAAGAMPVLAATLVLTFSRGGIAVAVCALAASCVIARPAALAGAIASTGVPSAAAGLAAWSSDLLATSRASTAPRSSTPSTPEAHR